MKALEKFNDNLEERYRRLYGGRNCSEEIIKNKKELRILFIGIILLLCVGVLVGLLKNGVTDGVNTNEKGEITEVKRPEKDSAPVSFNTEVEVDTEEGTVVRQLHITIDPVGKKDAVQGDSAAPKKSRQEKIDDELRSKIAKLNGDTRLEKIVLPKTLQNGETLLWKLDNESNLPLYFVGAMIMLYFLYKKRFYAIEREERKAEESIVRELPEFINKMVLLLNAGVVVHVAFLKIMEDRNKIGAQPCYFYGQLEQINRTIRETNGILHQEFRSFAKRSGVKELMRVANIIGDNISKGADLAEKLRKENELLWFARKQQSKEKGRLAETKLTLPLMILLLVLIMVTIAPALLEI